MSAPSTANGSCNSSSSTAARVLLIEKKRAQVYALSVVIILLLGGIFHLDWSRLFRDPIEVPLSVYTEGAKLTVAYLTCLLTWLNNNNNNNDNDDSVSSTSWDVKEDGSAGDDAKWLQKTFLLIAAADTCFIAQVPAPGILIFMGVQTMFIVRHFSFGTKQADVADDIRKANLEHYKFHLAAVYLSSISICIVIAYLFWYPRVGFFSDTFLIFSIYFGFKCTSALAAYASVAIGRIPPLNARMIAIALTLFFICDHTVTGNLLLNQQEEDDEGKQYIVTSSLTWMFYGPALLLLALSGYSPEVLGFGSINSGMSMERTDSNMIEEAEASVAKKKL